MDGSGTLAYPAGPVTPAGAARAGELDPTPEPTVKKAKPLPHRNRSKSSRHRAKLKAKHRRVRLRRSSGERKTYR